MIKIFENKAAYDAAPKPTIESQVSVLESTKDVIYDGVNVITTEPKLADILYLDENNAPVFVSAATFKKANIPAAWTYVGEVIERVGPDKVRILNKDVSTAKFLGVCQYEWTTAQATDPIVLDGESHTKTIGLRFGLPDWNTTTDVEVTYAATTLADVAAAVQAAIEAKLTELSAPAATIAEWWAYADADNSRVIIQRDDCTDYRFYNCSGVTLISWRDMPANSSSGFRINGNTGNEHVMNVAKAAAYYGTNGRTPDANVPLNAAAGIVKKAAFDTSAYCAALREAYGSYDAYIAAEYKADFPQKLGCFGLPDGQELTAKYGPMTAPTKVGSTKPLYPALNWACNVAYNANGLRAGSWHLWDVREGCIIMDDSNNAAINTTRSAQGLTQIGNATLRWFAQRCYVHSAWIYYGNTGHLDNFSVNYTLQVGAVTLFKYR